MNIRNLISDGFGIVRCLEQASKASGNNDVEEKKNKTADTNTFLIQRDTEEHRKIGYWENRWAAGSTPWHRKEDINPFLVKYFEKLQVNFIVIAVLPS